MTAVEVPFVASSHRIGHVLFFLSVASYAKKVYKIVRLQRFYKKKILTPGGSTSESQLRRTGVLSRYSRGLSYKPLPWLGTGTWPTHQNTVRAEVTSNPTMPNGPLEFYATAC